MGLTAVQQVDHSLPHDSFYCGNLFSGNPPLHVFVVLQASCLHSPTEFYVSPFLVYAFAQLKTALSTPTRVRISQKFDLLLHHAVLAWHDCLPWPWRPCSIWHALVRRGI